MVVYLIGSLRNPTIPEIGNYLRSLGMEVFDDWFAAGPIADDSWQEYEKKRGHSYEEALKGYAAKHVFAFDYHHLNRCDVAVLALPAGKSGHLELGYTIGSGKRGYILLDKEPERSKQMSEFPSSFSSAKEGVVKLPEDWHWLTGVYEGEGCLTRNGRKENSHGLKIVVNMRDEDVVRKLHKISQRGFVYGPYKGQKETYSDMWRWVVHKREDILYILRSMWKDLSKRRKEQIIKNLKDAGISEEKFFSGGQGAREFRWDQMYQFASGVFTAKEQLGEELVKYGKEREVGQAVSGVSEACGKLVKGPVHESRGYFSQRSKDSGEYGLQWIPPWSS